jgi:hypothetical protein
LVLSKQTKPKSNYPWKNYAPELHPKHYIFMSVDVIDSTKIKANSDNIHEWLDSFIDLLPEIQVIYAKKFNDRVKDCTERQRQSNGCLKCKAADVWKFIGDEVVLVADVHCKGQLHYNLYALRDVLHDINNKSLGLACKATAWVAGFPVTNVEVRLPKGRSDSDNEYLIDYIGKSIDLGFRLAKFSTKSRLVISSSLASLLHESANDPKVIPDKDNPLKIYSSGFIDLKGVKDGKAPLFWIAATKPDREESLLLTPVDPANLKQFFQEFYEGKIRPFIIGDDNPPLEYLEEYKKTVKELKKRQLTLFNSKNTINIAKSKINTSSIEKRVAENAPK